MLKYEHQSLVDKEVTEAYFELSRRLFDQEICKEWNVVITPVTHDL